MTKKATTAEFIASARAVHEDRFTYTEVEYLGLKVLVTITCPVHGNFDQRPGDHLAGKGCQQCGRAAGASARSKPVDAFIKQARAVHGDRYDYSGAIYRTTHTPVTIICREHGPFDQAPSGHLGGKGCAACALAKQSLNQTFDQAEFLRRARAAHGDAYDYSLACYIQSQLPVTIVCREHGPFDQAPINHWGGQGCRKCFDERNRARLTKSTADFLAAAGARHGATFDYSNVAYTGSKDAVSITCPAGHSFEQRPNDHLDGHGCPACTIVSEPEREIQTYLESLGETVTANCRKSLGGKEIDLLVGDLAIEYDGLYWHSELQKPASYHADKTQQAARAGLKMIHIFEDEWLEKREIVKARLAAKLGHVQIRYARALALAQVGWLMARDFYESTHLQGAGAPGESWGLYDGCTLVACITLARRRGAVEVMRYASLGSVVGGFARVFKQYLRAHPEVLEVVSYSDLRWGAGEVYGKNGFVRGADTAPGYFWVRKLRRYSREKFQKHKLDKLLPKFDPTQSEAENMRANGYAKIYDCGHAKWLWSRKDSHA